MKNAFFSRLAVFSTVLCVASPLAALAEAVVGEPAPTFTVENADGKKVSLDDFKGHTVVLEWSNYDCPFVKKHYGSGNMQKLQEKYTGKDVKWLTVFSSAHDKQGYYEPEKLKARAKEVGSHSTELLRDPEGTVGKAYGAQTTPHMFVIDKEGKVAYAGAIDDKSGMDPAEVKDAKNYVVAALDALAEGKTPEVASTKSYGCGVKY